jgi:hypothetical protein
VGSLAIEDKIASELGRADLTFWARRVPGRIELVVKLFPDGDFTAAVRSAKDLGGTVLGEAGISIHSMALEPTNQDNTALMVLSVNSAVPDAVVASLVQSSGILGVDRISL